MISSINIQFECVVVACGLLIIGLILLIGRLWVVDK